VWFLVLLRLSRRIIGKDNEKNATTIVFFLLNCMTLQIFLSYWQVTTEFPLFYVFSSSYQKIRAILFVSFFFISYLCKLNINIF